MIAGMKWPALFLSIIVLLAGSAGAADAQTKDLRRVLELPPREGNPRNSEGDFMVLRDGRILFVYTHFTGGAWDDARADLASRVSADGGVRWSDRDEAVPTATARQNVMSVCCCDWAKARWRCFTW